ncbi:MAG: choice-of-anchor L domain-containing protein [Bacteroidota bacterium]
MKNALLKISLSLIVLLTVFKADAQLTVNGSSTPTQLVQNVLLGTGVTATNITYNGNSSAIGSFNGSSSNIGLSAGVILASGNISNAIGPNNTGSAGTSFSFFGGSDPDLNAISANTTFDRAVLEFDFIPTSDTVKFRYVFGSEEYLEFVNSGVNDAFGFFISGPGITGPYSNNSKNIAIIPGTTTPVTIDDVNDNLNGIYYFDNESPAGQTIQYDGFTVPLTAVSAVQCGQTYHIKIAIADAGDASWDSGVFLEAGSFSSQGVNILSQISYGGSNDSTLYEGCGAACIYFVRSSNLSNADTVNLIIGGTAVNGTDYYDNNIGPGTAISGQIIFSIGQDSASFCFNAVDDGSSEGMESIELSVASSGVGLCIQQGSSSTIYLNEYSPLILSTSGDTTLCNFLAPVTLSTSVSGGVEPYTYSWTNGAGTAANPIVNPTISTTYAVTVNDACIGSPLDPTPAVVDSVIVTLVSIPVITIDASYGGVNDSALYEGCGQACIYFVRPFGIAQAASYNLNVTGTATAGADYNAVFPPTLNFAAGQDSLSYCINALADGAGESVETMLLSISVPGICNLSTIAALKIEEPLPLLLNVSNDTSLCNTLASVSITASVTGGVPPYSYTWANGVGTTANLVVNPITTTTYIVTVNDACSAVPDATPSVMDSLTVSLVTIPAITSSVSYGGTNDTTLYEGCGQACIYFVRTLDVAQPATYTLNIAGAATNGVDYTPVLPAQLVFAAGQDSLIYCITALGDGTGETVESLLVSISISGACNLSSNTALNIEEPAPLELVTTNDTSINCVPGPVNLFVNVSGGVLPYTYSWSNGAGSVSSQTVTPLTNTTYIVTVADACTGNPDATPDGSDTIQVNLNVPDPLVVSAGNDLTACPDDMVNLGVITTGGALPLTYLWTSAGVDTVNSSSSANTNSIATSSTLFTISVTDNCGNNQNDQVMVNVEQSCLLNIPNVITPEGKGAVLNETFYIDNLNRFPASSLVIYNRFGNKLFETSDYQNNWSGSKYSDGTYFYLLTVPPAGPVTAKVKPSSESVSHKEASVGNDKVFTGFFQIVRANN